MEERLSRETIGAAIEVHRAMGPGLLESVYLHCLEHELLLRRLTVEREVPVKLNYKGLDLGRYFRMDLAVDGLLVLELKAVEKVLPVHEVQLLSCLRMTGRRLGLLLSFNVPVMRDGVRRIVNGF